MQVIVEMVIPFSLAYAQLKKVYFAMVLHYIQPVYDRTLYLLRLYQKAIEFDRRDLGLTQNKYQF